MDPSIRYLALDGDTVAWGAQARLYDINVATAAGSAVVTVYNGTTASGELKALIDASSLRNLRFYGARFPAGLYITLTGGDAKVSVTAS